jgi:hypothetical protein
VRIEELERVEVDAIVLTPAHQHPTGAVLAGDRRPALLEWLRARDAVEPRASSSKPSRTSSRAVSSTVTCAECGRITVGAETS